MCKISDKSENYCQYKNHRFISTFLPRYNFGHYIPPRECRLFFLPTFRMWLVTVQMYLWGMGVNLARQAGHLINAEIRLEQYLQGVCKKMNILMAKKPGKKTKMR